MNSLKEYIIQVCKDSCVAEQRPVNVKFQYTIIGERLIFAVRCTWWRVTRRINYRLSNNLYKNFCLSFCNIEDPNCCFDFLSEDIDPNFSIAEWEVFGKWGTIRICEDDVLNPHMHISSSRYEKNRSQKISEAWYKPNWGFSKTSEDWKSFAITMRRLLEIGHIKSKKRFSWRYTIYECLNHRKRVKTEDRLLYC